MYRSSASIVLATLLMVFAVQASQITLNRTLTEPELSFADGYHHFTSTPGPLWGLPGNPELPHAGHSVLLPPAEEITSVKLENELWQLVPGQINLWPAQMPVPYSRIGEQPFTPPDPAIYSSDDLYPSSPVEVFRTDFLCGHGIGTIAISTARYRPLSGQLEVLISYDLILETEPSIRAQESFDTMLRQTPQVVQRVTQGVENPEALPAYGAPDQVDQTAVKYLIITGSAFEPLFQQLAEHRTNRGLQAEIVLFEDILNQYTGIDMADQVRNCVIDYYQTQGLEYVLLGGDTEYIPHRGLYAAVGEEVDEDIPADLYFSNLDGNWNSDGDERWGEPPEADLYAEVAVGRMPVDTEDEVQNLIAKTIAYDNSPVVTDLEIGLMLGEDLGWLSWGWEYKEEIHLGSNNWGYTTAGFPPNFSVNTLYEYSGISWSAMTDLLPLLNGGVHLVNHLGHANNSYCFKFNTSQVNDNNMTNNGVNHNFYFLYSQGCYAGSFDNRTPSGNYTSDAIGEQFTIIQHGAMAFICNSRYGWGSYNNTNGASQYYDREFFDALFAEDDIRTLGWLNADSKEDNNDRLGSATYWCYYQTNLMGDPAIDVWTAMPLTYSPIYPDTVLMGTTQIEVDVGAPDAYVAIIFDGEVIGIGYSNGSGIATVFLYEAIAVPGELLLSITGHNYLPYQGSIQAVTSSGPYVIMLNASFDDSAGGNGDGNPDLGETLSFTVEFQNVGVDSAIGLNATLECDDYCVDINQGGAFIGDLPVGAIIEAQDAFEATLLPSVHDGQIFTFLVTVTDNLGSSWTSDFQITAFAPELQLLSWNIDDGNDGHLMPGETATLDLEIINMGSGGTTDLTIWLATDNPLAGVNIPSNSLEPLVSGASGSVSELEFTLSGSMIDPSALVLYITATDTRDYQKGFLIEVPVGGEFDDMESGVGEWTHESVTPGWFDQWNLASLLNHTPGGTYSWYCGQSGQYGELLDAGLMTPLYQISGSHLLRFYHWMSAEISSQYPGYAYDGGIVEFSLDGGAFQQITPRGGYPYLIRESSYPVPLPAETPCYSGQIIWDEAIFDIEGEGTAQFRFRFVSDGATNSVGWFVDDLELVKVSDPNVPTNLEASISGPEVTITWNTPNSGGSDGKGSAGGRQGRSLERYRIYRDGALIDSVEALSYVDNLSSLPYTTYYYQVSGVFNGVEGALSEPVAADYVWAEPLEEPPLPKETALGTAYPNPFNPVVNLRFDVAKADFVTLTVYDLMGRTVATILSDQLSAGTHEVSWNAGQYASGLYLVRMETESYTGIQKVLLLK